MPLAWEYRCEDTQPDDPNCRYGQIATTNIAILVYIIDPRPKAAAAYNDAAGELHRYPDGDCRALREALARNAAAAADGTSGCDPPDHVRMFPPGPPSWCGTSRLLPMRLMAMPVLPATPAWYW